MREVAPCWLDVDWEHHVNIKVGIGTKDFIYLLLYWFKLYVAWSHRSPSFIFIITNYYNKKHVGDRNDALTRFSQLYKL